MNVQGGELTIYSILPNKKIQQHFQIDETHPILQLDRKLETNNVDFSFYSQVFCNTEKHGLIGSFLIG